MSAVKLDVPLSVEEDELIQQAAAIVGKSAAEFAASVLTKRAKKILRQNQFRILSQKDWDRFMEIVGKDKPNEDLRQAVTEYKRHHE